jgi:hypothetical protein
MKKMIKLHLMKTMVLKIFCKHKLHVDVCYIDYSDAIDCIMFGVIQIIILIRMILLCFMKSIALRGSDLPSA